MTQYRDGFQGGVQKYDFSIKSISRGFILLLMPIFAYTIGLFPLIWSFLNVLEHLNLSNLLHLFIFSGFLVVLFFLFIIIETFIPGLFIRLLRLRVDEGVYDISIRDWNFFKYSLYFVSLSSIFEAHWYFTLVSSEDSLSEISGVENGKKQCSCR